MTRRTSTAAAVLVALVALSGCGDDEPDTIPEPTASSTSASPTPDSGGPPPGWEEKFTAEQLRTYNAALTRYERYRQLTEPIYRAGKDTPEARETLKAYSATWQRDVVDLADFDAGGVRILEPPKPLWTYAKSIKPTYVVLIQCTDYTNIKVTQNGEEVTGTKPKNLVTPLVVKMTKPEGRNWLFAGEELKDKSACDA